MNTVVLHVHHNLFINKWIGEIWLAKISSIKFKKKKRKKRGTFFTFFFISHQSVKVMCKHFFNWIYCFLLSLKLFKNVILLVNGLQTEYKKELAIFWVYIMFSNQDIDNLVYIYVLVRNWKRNSCNLIFFNKTVFSMCRVWDTSINIEKFLKKM